MMPEAELDGRVCIELDGRVCTIPGLYKLSPELYIDVPWEKNLVLRLKG